MVSANDAAAIAIQLFRLDARLCDQHPMKVARTTDNPSVSGNTLQEATTSLACCSNTQDIRLSHDASVQTNPCTVFQVNPVHTTDLSRSLSDAQITQTTSTCSQTESNDKPPTLIKVNTATESSAKEHNNSSIAPVESMAQKQEGTSAQVSRDEDLLKNTDDHIKPSDQNGTSEHLINKDILKHLDVASLSIPDCLMHDLQDINLALMETVKKPLKHIASFQTGNFIIFFITSISYIITNFTISFLKFTPKIKHCELDFESYFSFY